MEDIFKINMLLIYYKNLLTERQKKCLEMYYEYDYSLNEIADILKISKQGVSNNIKRGIENLSEYEDKLKMINNRFKNEKKLEILKELFDEFENNSKDYDSETLSKIKKVLFNMEVEDDIWITFR